VTNIYKFILVIYSLNENRYRNLYTFLNQFFKVYYEHLIQLKKEIEANLDLFSEFQKTA
jgi:vacuolar-type H+-ATPase subunit C/Vma6